VPSFGTTDTQQPEYFKNNDGKIGQLVALFSCLLSKPEKKPEKHSFVVKE
jgi:hypothetical protein